MKSLTRRALTPAAPMLAGALLLAACGGSSHGSSPNSSNPPITTTVASTSTTASVPPPGPALAAALVKLMAKNQHQLKNVKPHCPSGQAKHFPVNCQFTATEYAPRFKKTYHMVGKITVTGGQGDQFEYGLNYAPTH